MRSSVVMTCLRCGGPLPDGCGQSRRYCEECAKERNREKTRERRLAKLRAGYERMVAEQKASQAKLDREYCKPCQYYGSEEYGHNLCDYMLVTGHRRGCHYGTGCERRVIKQEGEADERLET